MKIFTTKNAYAFINNYSIPIPYSGILCTQNELDWKYRFSLGWVYGWSATHHLWQSTFDQGLHPLYHIPITGVSAVKSPIYPEYTLTDPPGHTDLYMIYSVMEDRMVADCVKDPEGWIQHLKENNELLEHEDRFDIIPVKTVKTVKLEMKLETRVKEVKR